MAGEIQGIAGVLIWTERARFGEMARFYRDRLGLTPRTDKPDFISFDWAGLRLSVSVHDGVQGASRDPLRIMLNLIVDDIDAAHAQLRAAGVVFTRPPEAEDWGGRVATFLDPDGNTLQLFQLPRGRARGGRSLGLPPGVGREQAIHQADLVGEEETQA